MKNVLRLFLLAAIPSSAFGAGINCGLVKANSSIVEKSICEEAKLKTMDSDLSAIFEKLQKQLKGHSRELLKQTQVFFLRERNDCQNQSASGDNFTKLVKSCLELKYQNRLSSLKNFDKDSDSFSNLTKGITFFDVGFVKKYGQNFLGKTIKVAGTLTIDTAKSAAPTSLTGGIKDKNDVLPVVFKSMPNAQAEFLEQNKPFGHHEGLVEEQQGKVVLRVSSILGEKLP